MEWCAKQDLNASVFVTLLLTTSFRFRGETFKEQARALSMSGRVVSAGAMFCFLETMT